MAIERMVGIFGIIAILALVFTTMKENGSKHTQRRTIIIESNLIYTDNVWDIKSDTTANLIIRNNSIFKTDTTLIFKSNLSGVRYEASEFNRNYKRKNR